MFEAVRQFRGKLDAGRRCLGPGITLSDPAVTEALGQFADFVWIDLEHSPIGPEALSAHVIAARAAGAAALVRVAGSDEILIKPALDIGAEGIIIPQVRSAAEVRRAVSVCRYPPRGHRGYGPRRMSSYGRLGAAEYVRTADASLFVSVQIESALALAELGEILATPGLDGIVVGPYDLSFAMGKPGELTDPEIRAAIVRVVREARSAGRYVGMGMGPDDEPLADWAFSIGVQWVQCGGDCGYMVQFADRLYERIRGRIGGPGP
jgi:2-dehydro-3-deoxyglucarate aldolase/4-hydroxy-2-oxoheptanedioate aldolase